MNDVKHLWTISNQRFSELHCLMSAGWAADLSTGQFEGVAFFAQGGVLPHGAS